MPSIAITSGKLKRTEANFGTLPKLRLQLLSASINSGLRLGDGGILLRPQQLVAAAL
jgi:hypothetical protein